MTQTIDTRQAQLTFWLKQVLPQGFTSLIAIQNDASFRRYFRVIVNDKTYIAMDAPPEKENCAPFVNVATHLKQKINVPEIIAQDLEQGFLLLSDFGDTQLLDVINQENANAYYQKAMRIIRDMQTITIKDLPVFTKELASDRFDLFSEWYIEKYQQIKLTQQEQILLADIKNLLIENMLAQPFVFVHRDFHSRNLMVLADENFGVLDFQDAVLGPITYDLISLLKDCYIRFSKNEIRLWVADFYQLIQPNLNNISQETFIRWFDLMGLHRHLRILGTFSRLHLRDGKDRYLDDMPRIFAYVLEVCADYPELKALHEFLKKNSVNQKELATA